MSTVYDETMFILKKYGINANKNLGQNFLINDEVIEKIIDSSDIKKDDLVIEIGPGLGTLTSRLLEKAGRVIAIELDKRMISILNERFALYNNFELINDDVLKVDLNKLIYNTTNSIDGIKSVKVVANLPYYITTPIIMKLLEEKLNIESITVMVQKEVGQRLTAVPGGKYTGAISYCVNYYCIPSEIVLVPNSSFIPEPEVESEVIKLIIRKEQAVNVNNEDLFFKFIKASFMQRRKTLVNGISNSGMMTKDEITELLKKVGLNEKTRGETLSLEDFANIVNNI